MKLKFTKPLSLKLPAYTRVHITLVGCGGTGSHVASGLASIGQALTDKAMPWDMTFIDGDIVEAKNCGRQLFSPADIGRNKADVLATRLNAAFGLAIGAGMRFIDDRDTFLHPEQGALNIVLDCVDNQAARILIDKQVTEASGRLWWLSSGNEKHSGQVLLGNASDRKRIRPGLGFVDCLPSPALQYPDLVAVPKLKVKKARKAPSCADLAATGEQGLMVNRRAAAEVLTMLDMFLLGELRYFGLAYDLQEGGVKVWSLDEGTLASEVMR